MTTGTLSDRPDIQPKLLRLESLDGVRGLAALFVAWFHIYQLNEQLRPNGITNFVMYWTSEYGWLGVQAFFVITGFVIPYSLRNRGHLGGGANAARFLAKRGLRLYPPFFAAAALTFVIILGAPLVPFFSGQPTPVEAGWIAANVSLLAPFFGESWANPVFWSLLVEVQYYLVIAALFAASPMVTRRRFEISMAICVAACLGAAFTPPFLHSALTWAPFFVIGYLLYQHMVQGRPPAILIPVAAIACLAALMTGEWRGLIAAAITAGVILARWSPGRFLLGLGAISYSLYLIHYPIGVRAARLFGRIDVPAIEILAYVAAMALVVCTSAVFYFAVEKPSLLLSRSIRYD